MDAHSRLRFDGVEQVTDTQRKALARLEAESQAPVAGVIRHGHMVALHGRFGTDSKDPAGAARVFIEEHARALGFDLSLESDVFGAPRFIQCFTPQFSGEVTTVLYPHAPGGVPSYRGGVAVGVDASGSVRALISSIPSRDPLLKGSAPDRARKAVAGVLGGREPGDPEFCVFDPERVLGEARTAFGAWLFRVAAENPFEVIVADGSDEVFRVVTNPGCPVGALPVYHRNPVTGAPSFLMFPGSGLLLAEATTGNPVTVARALFQRYPKLFGTGQPSAQLALVDVLTGFDPSDPATTIVFEQRWGALPVFGCQLRVHLSPALSVRSVSGNFLRDPGVPTTPAVSESAARTTAATTTAADNQARIRPGLHRNVIKRLWKFHQAHKANPGKATAIPMTGAEDRGLTILPTALTRSGLGANHLAWWFRFDDADRFISATTGALVLTLSRRHSSERVFDAQQATAPANTNLQFADGVPQVAPADLDPEAQAAAAAVSSVDAFWRTFGRNSWDGAGGNMDAFVDTLFTNGPNANWNGVQTKFSVGFAVPDVVGHEFTHAVTQATANLAMLDESGAANEHYSDLFGNLIFPDVAAGSWLVGELIAAPPPGLPRDMRNPVVATYQNYFVTPPNNDFGGVHTNCGILNRAAVLLCDGTAGGPAGIGRSRIARLAWETLTRRLHPLASFTDILHLTWGVAMELAASRVLGAAGIPGTVGLPPAFDQTVPDTVAWAFQQVGLNLDVQLGWSDVTVNTAFTPGPGGFVANVTLYGGMNLTDGRTLSDMEVRLFRRSVLNGTMRESGGAAFNAADGSFAATMAVPLGTASLETQVQITSPTALTVGVIGVPTIQDPPGPQPAVDQPPLNPLDTPLTRHWNDFGLGGRYDERLFEGAQLAEGCFVTQVELHMVDVNGNTLESTTDVGQRLGDHTRGVYLISRTLGGRTLQADVHSWYEGGYVIRYKLRYTVAGAGCGLPDFTVRDITSYP